MNLLDYDSYSYLDLPWLSLSHSSQQLSSCWICTSPVRLSTRPTGHPVRLGTSEGLGPSRTGYLWRTGTQSDWVTSHDWNWCIPTSRVFETWIFLSSNFKKMRKYRFYWWSYFVYLFMIEVLNDFGLLKRIYVFWSKRDPVGTGYQSYWVPSPTGWSVRLVPSPTGWSVRLVPSPTGWSVRLVPSHPVGDWNWCIPSIKGLKYAV